MIKEKIILALDVESPEIARRIIEETLGEIGAFKIGLELFSVAGPRFVRELTERGLRIFLDLKFHDIPNTVAKASIAVARMGVWMFNVHASGGGEMLRRTVNDVSEYCEREKLSRPKITAVTVLTSLTPNTLREIGIEENVETQVSKLAKLAQNCGLDGVVASPHEIRSIKESIPYKDFLVVTPGVRPSFATIDDQKRVMTPADAFSAGADYLVIGRPILGAENKREAIARIVGECEQRVGTAVSRK